MLVLGLLLHGVLNSAFLVAKCLLEELELLFDVLPHVLPIKLGNGVELHHNLRSHVPEGHIRLQLPPSRFVLGHVDGPALEHFSLLLHLEKNFLLQKRLGRDQLPGRLLVSQELFPDAVRREAALLLQEARDPKVGTPGHVFLRREHFDRRAG